MNRTVGRAAAVLLTLILLLTAVPAVYAADPGEIQNASVSDEGILTWDAYPGAVSYRVGVSYFYKTTTDTSYDIKAFIDEAVSYDQISPSGTTYLTIRAYDSLERVIARWELNPYTYESDAEVTPKGTIANVKIDGEGMLSWDEWPGTDRYWVGVKGLYRTSRTEDPLTYDVDDFLDEFESYGDLFKEGTHEVEIYNVTAEGYTTADWEGFVTVTKNGEGWNYTLFEGSNVVRLAGSNRYATAIRAAEYLKQQFVVSEFENIVIASGADYPDALSASYLAYWKKAPILLINDGSMAEVAEYAGSNLKPGGTVYIVGGTGSVSQSAEDAIAEKTGSESIVRFAGKNRYETNLLVLKECDKAGGLENERLIFASGKDFADALSASAAGIPIVLVGDVLLEDQIAFIDEVKPKLDSGYVFIAGGTGAISQAVEDTLKAADGLALNTKRYAGSNRYETSMLIAADLFPGDPDTVVIANAANFPDGLAGGPIGAYYWAPLILVTDKVYDHAAQKYENAGSKRLIVMGGTGVIADATVNAIVGE